MSTVKLSNVSLAEWRRFLKHCGCNYHRTKGGHEMWGKSGLTREVVVQTHIDPIPEFIIKNNLKTLGVSTQEFKEWLLSDRR